MRQGEKKTLLKHMGIEKEVKKEKKNLNYTSISSSQDSWSLRPDHFCHRVGACLVLSSIPSLYPLGASSNDSRPKLSPNVAWGSEIR